MFLAAWLLWTTPLGAQAADTAAADTAAAPVGEQQQARDAELRETLQAIFDRVPTLEGIETAVDAGVVRLSGRVPDREAADRAVELARGREGVVYVDDAALEPISTEARLEDVGGRLQDQIDAFVARGPLLAVALGLVVVFCLLAWAVGRVRTTRLFPRANPFLGGALLRLVQFLIVIFGLVVALELLDATALVGAVVGTAGLAGLALGFAFKDIAENYLAGIILSLRQPFAKNDLIVVGGHEGKVVRLTGRETILMTPEGNHVQIPNATVFQEPMINYTRNPRRRFTVDVDVAAETELSAALDIGLATLQSMRGVIDDPAPSGIITGYGSGTMALRFHGWVDQRSAEFLLVRSEAIRLVKDALEGAGVELPSPEYRVTLGGGGEPGGAPEAGRPPAPGRTVPSTVEKTAPQRDVSVDRTLDEEIERERQQDDEENLLE